jgi:hypothetical protein
LHLTYNIQIGSAREKLYVRSFDLGQTWQDAETLSTLDGRNAVEAGMASSDSTVYVAWRDGVACAGFIGCTIIGRETVTNGLTWNQAEVLTNIPRGTDPSVAIGPTGLMVSTWSDEIQFNGDYHVVLRYRWPDSSWSEIVDLTPTIGGGLSQVAVSSKAIHVVWYAYVPGPPESFRIFYRRGRFLTNDVDERKQEMPTTTYLMQNYPNPYNATTTIVWRVVSRELVSLKVFDVLGREVATLVNERKDAGEHTVEWNAGRLPSGVYYYRLFTGARTETKKALLIR